MALVPPVAANNTGKESLTAGVQGATAVSLRLQHRQGYPKRTLAEPSHIGDDDFPLANGVQP